MWSPLPGYSGLLFDVLLVLAALLFVGAIVVMFVGGLLGRLWTLLVPSARRRARALEAERMAEIHRQGEDYRRRRDESIARAVQRREEAWLAEHPGETFVPLEVRERFRGEAFDLHPYRPWGSDR